MKYLRIILLAGALALVPFAGAWAQQGGGPPIDTDLTYTQAPIVVIGLDTAGSMQFRAGGLRRDDVASLACGLTAGEKSKQIMLQEVLTGTFENYALSTITASTSAGGSVDQCNYGSYKATFTSQLNDGVLDSYRERVRFAFFGFDANPQKTGGGSTTNPDGPGPSYNPSGSYPTTHERHAPLCASPAGCGADYSYTATGVANDATYIYKVCEWVSGSCDAACGCATGRCVKFTDQYTYGYCMGNVGSKSERSTAAGACMQKGCFVSCGADGTAISELNDDVQDEVLNVTSTGPRPTAGVLKDVTKWWETHPDVKLTSSPTQQQICRRRHVIVLTDGQPEMNCGYDSASIANKEICLVGPTCTTNADCKTGFQCVSGRCMHQNRNQVQDAAKQWAAELFNPTGGNRRQTLVHTIALDNPTALSCVLDIHCPYGQTCQIDLLGANRCSCADDTQCAPGYKCTDVNGFKECRLGTFVEEISSAGGGKAIRVTDAEGVRQAFSTIIDNTIVETTARTRVTSTSAVKPLNEPRNQCPAAGEVVQFLFSAAFQVPPDGIHWKGLLQRTGIGNAGTSDDPILGPIFNSPTVHGTVRFDELLNTQPKPVDDQGTAYDRKIYTFKDGAIREFTKTNITRGDLNVSSNAERDRVIDFIRGEPGSARAANRMGAIYHSSPVVLEPPVLDLPISSYQFFKANTQIRARPPMVFVGSNLGMLHAFNARTGKEEFAFIPPALLPTLKNQLNGFTWGVDGPPVTRDIQLTTLDEDLDPRGLKNWRSVVIAGIGWSAYAYFALEVTDPVWRSDNDPPFRMLWEADDDLLGNQKMGVPFASPTVGTVFLDDTARGFPFQERAVAVLPGGKKPQGMGIGGNQGERILILDLGTGALLKDMDFAPGGGGATGGCAAHDDFPGQFLTRVFCGNNRGQIARINIADPVIANWTLQDEFATLGSGGGPQQPIFVAPALAPRTNGNVMMIVGSGNPRDLEGSTGTTGGPTRIGFFEEVPVFDSGTGNLTGFTSQTLQLLEYPSGEKLTSPPVVFNSIAYFTTFLPDASAECTFGRARIWGVAFDKVDTALSDPISGGLIPKLESNCGPDRIIDTSDDASGITSTCLLVPNSVTFGMDVVRQPALCQPGASGSSGSGSQAPLSGTGELKLVFQTGAGVVTEESKLRDPTLTPPGAQTINIGAVNLRQPVGQARIMSWAKVIP